MFLMTTCPVCIVPGNKSAEKTREGRPRCGLFTVVALVAMALFVAADVQGAEDPCWEEGQISVKEESLSPQLKKELDAYRQGQDQQPEARRQKLAQLQELERQIRKVYDAFIRDAQITKINDTIAQFLAAVRPIGPAFRAYCNTAAALPGGKAGGVLAAASTAGAACEKGFAWASDFEAFLNCHSGDNAKCAKVVLKTLAGQSGRSDVKQGVETFLEGKEGYEKLKDGQYVQALKNVCALGVNATRADLEKVGDPGTVKHLCQAVTSMDTALDYQAQADKVTEEKVDRELALKVARQNFEQRLGELVQRIDSLERSIARQPAEDKAIEKMASQRQMDKYAECKAKQINIDDKTMAELERQLQHVGAEPDSGGAMEPSAIADGTGKSDLLKTLRSGLGAFRQQQNALKETKRAQQEANERAGMNASPGQPLPKCWDPGGNCPDYRGQDWEGNDFELSLPRSPGGGSSDSRPAN